MSKQVEPVKGGQATAMAADQRRLEDPQQMLQALTGQAGKTDWLKSQQYIGGGKNPSTTNPTSMFQGRPEHPLARGDQVGRKA